MGWIEVNGLPLFVDQTSDNLVASVHGWYVVVAVV